MKDIRKTLVRADDTIEKAVGIIQDSGVGIALVVDSRRHLEGTITDGDIRRAILNRLPFTAKIIRILENRPTNYSKPITAAVGTSHTELLSIMEDKIIRHIPLLDGQGEVVELALLSELIEEEHHLPLAAVIMAGGEGQRLRPLTNETPKPMLLLNDRPILERTIEQLKKSAITDICISTNYKSEVISDYFGDGKSFGVGIKYLKEDQPLGTAGALSLNPSSPKTTLVINGDILTQLDFRLMHEFHRTHQAVMTVGVRKYDIDIPYGVVEADDVAIVKLIEKPSHAFIVNAGIYLIEPLAYQYIPQGRRFDMTDLVNALIQAKHRVISFPIQEYWLDVGRHDDYQKAKTDVQNGKF